LGVSETLVSGETCGANEKTMVFVMAIIEPREVKAMIQDLRKMMSGNTEPICLSE